MPSVRAHRTRLMRARAFGRHRSSRAGQQKYAGGSCHEEPDPSMHWMYPPFGARPEPRTAAPTRSDTPRRSVRHVLRRRAAGLVRGRRDARRDVKRAGSALALRRRVGRRRSGRLRRLCSTCVCSRRAEAGTLRAERDSAVAVCLSRDPRCPPGLTNIVATTAAADASATAEPTAHLRPRRGRIRRSAGSSSVASRSRSVMSRTCSAQASHSGQNRRCVVRRSSSSSGSSPSS